MKTSDSVWIIIMIVVIIFGGWYLFSNTPVRQYASTSGTGLNGSPSQTIPAPVTPIVTISKDAKLGDFLLASNGMTLYMFTKDTAGKSNCNGACAVLWPPYSATTTETPAPGSGITGQFSATPRADGKMQVTYKGSPVYFYQKDTKPGDTLGQNFAGLWFVVKP